MQAATNDEAGSVTMAVVEVSQNGVDFTQTAPNQIFAFRNQPRLSKLQPHQGPSRGGTEVTIAVEASAWKHNFNPSSVTIVLTTSCVVWQVQITCNHLS